VETLLTDAEGNYAFTELAPGFYGVLIVVPDGTTTLQDSAFILVRGGSAAVVDFQLESTSGLLTEDLPSQLTCGAFPNPFNPMTNIRFELPHTSVVSLDIYDSAGRLVRRLIDAEMFAAGRHGAVWRGRDQAGRGAASGIYHYYLKVDGAKRLGKITLLK